MPQNSRWEHLSHNPWARCLYPVAARQWVIGLEALRVLERERKRGSYSREKFLPVKGESDGPFPGGRWAGIISIQWDDLGREMAT